MQYILLVTSIVSLIFAVTVLDQYFARRKPYQLLWAIGMLMYCLAAFAEFWWVAYGPAAFMYRLWYLIGAILVAAYLGQGTLYLLMRRKTAHIIMAILGLFTIYSVIRIFTVSIDISGLTSLTGIGVMPIDIRLVVTPILNIFGTFALVGGAVYSAWIFWRKRILPHRVIGNVLIALGALMPAIGGTQTSLGGGVNLSYIMEMLGAIVMFIGFMRTKEVFGFYRFPLIHGFGRVRE